MTDIHTHSTFSMDGQSPLSDMVRAAKEAGLRYFGVSEHFDADSNTQELFGTDAASYFPAARTLQRSEGEGFTLLVGAEFGFSHMPAAQERFLALQKKYRPDFVVNSVHIVDGCDCWFPDYFAGKTKERAYRDYLEYVLQSLGAPYPYDIVGHIGYVSRNAPYEDRKISYSDFSALYDEILSAIVEKGKILEVNSSCGGAGSDFLPDTDVLCRYFELGGRKVSFGSDAHGVSRVAEKRALITDALKKIGFTSITVPAGKEIEVPI